MQAKTRVMVNTAVLYGKAVITTILSLISVPIILRALGQSDYGLYNLLAGVIAMLSFLNASMTVSTQRFLSVTMGEGNSEKLNFIYNTSITLHLIIGLFVILLFEVFAPLLFSGFLSIEPERVAAAKIVYQVLVISTFFTIISVPFNAVLNAYEDLVVFAIIHIFEALLKLLVALMLIYCTWDRLIYYSVGIAIIAIVVFLIKLVYVYIKYKQLTLSIKKFFSREQFNQMFGFAGWNTMGSVALLGRNQGIAIVMNVFFGTLINAAYGIANQINGLMSYLSSTLQQAINPQLMKSEGMNDRERLIRISFISSKYSVLAICLPAIPLIIEMPYVLLLWLRDIPPYTIVFSQLVLTLTIVAQYSSGIQSLIQSVGRIRPYFITVSLILLLNIPLSYFLLKMGCPPYYTIICFIILEAVALLIRLLFARKYVGVSIRNYLKSVLFPTLLPLFCAGVPSYLLHITIPESFSRLVLISAVYAIIYLIMAWIFSLGKSEKDYFIKVLPLKRKRDNILI